MGPPRPGGPEPPARPAGGSPGSVLPRPQKEAEAPTANVRPWPGKPDSLS